MSKKCRYVMYGCTGHRIQLPASIIELIVKKLNWFEHEINVLSYKRVYTRVKSIYLKFKYYQKTLHRY